MKIINLVALFILSSTIVRSQNVGIGTTNPVARLHVTDSAVLFTGPATLPASTSYGPPAEGAGSRMFWYPQKAAFRAGIVDGTHWDKDSIGRFSFAAGYNTKAKGEGAVAIGTTTSAIGAYSFSIGNSTTASGSFSTSMGTNTSAEGEVSTSMGISTIASGYKSTAMGFYTIASGENSTSMGNSTIASGINSISMGGGTLASGLESISMGTGTKARGISSVAMGRNTIARSDHSLSIGQYNDSSNTASVFEIGNGTANNARKNALTVLMNGNIGIGNNSPDALLSFAAATGEKIALFPYNATQRHGISVFGGAGYSAMRFYVPSTADYLSWGVGSNNSFAENMSLDGNGVLRVRTSVIAPYAFAPSDLRYKKGLQIINSPLDKINQLSGYTYYYKTNDFPSWHFSERQQVGLIAQEVEAILPQAVNTDADGYKAVDYAKLVPLLIEGIKAQNKKIESLENSIKRIAELEKMIEDLKLSLQIKE